MKKNDERILDLRTKIEAKRKAVGPARRFLPETHCSLEIDGLQFNLHVVNKSVTASLLIRLNSVRMSADDLGIEHPPISGYLVKDWIADLKARLAYLDTKEEHRRLARLEAELEKLLSDEKQTELAVDKLAELI